MTPEEVTTLSAQLSRFHTGLQERLLIQCRSLIKSVFECETSIFMQDVQNLIEDMVSQKSAAIQAESITFCCYVCNNNFSQASVEQMMNNSRDVDLNENSNQMDERQQNPMRDRSYFQPRNNTDANDSNFEGPSSLNEVVDLKPDVSSIPTFEVGTLITNSDEIINTSRRNIDRQNPTVRAAPTSTQRPLNVQLAQAKKNLMSKTNSTSTAAVVTSKRPIRKIHTLSQAKTCRPTTMNATNQRERGSFISRKMRSFHSPLPNSQKFQCTYCTKIFTTQRLLASHLRNHTGETPFTCIHCNEKFKFSSALCYHIKKKHTKM